MDMETYDDLVGSIYNAPFRESGWEDVVSKLLEALNLPIAEVDQATGNVFDGQCLNRIKDNQVNYCEDHAVLDNPRFISTHQGKVEDALADFKLQPVTNNHSLKVQSNFHRKYGDRQELPCNSADNPNDCRPNMPNPNSRVQRRTDLNMNCEIEAFNLYRHMLQAVQLGEQMSRARNTNSVLEHTLDQLRLGILLVDRQGMIINLNSYAKQLIEQNDELFEKATKLQFMQKKYRHLLALAITQAATKGNSSIFSLPRQNQSPLSVSVIPFTESRASSIPHNCSISIFVSDPDDRKISDAVSLGKRWGLTSLESQFVLKLIQGQKIKQIANKLELTENTARWYSKQIMSKLGVKRQVDLNAKLMKDIAFLVETKSSESLN